jgi:hypothetical protein
VFDAIGLAVFTISTGVKAINLEYNFLSCFHAYSYANDDSFADTYAPVTSSSRGWMNHSTKLPLIDAVA